MQKSKENQPVKKRKRAGSKVNDSEDDYDDDSDAEIANDIESDDFDDTKMDDVSDEGWSFFLAHWPSAVQCEHAVCITSWDRMGDSKLD